MSSKKVSRSTIIDSAVLKSARESANLTQDAAANALGIHKITLSTYETGRRVPGPDIIAKMAMLYGTTERFLMTGDNLFRKPESIEAYRKYVESARKTLDHAKSRLGGFREANIEYGDRSGFEVPLAGQMPAGSGVELMDEEPSGPSLWLPFKDCKGAAAFTIVGDSMESLYHDGDVGQGHGYGPYNAITEEHEIIFQYFHDSTSV